MAPEEKLVLAVANNVVKGIPSPIRPLAEDKDIDWKRFRDILAYHSLTPFAYYSLKGSTALLPEWLNRELEATYYYSLKHISNLERLFLEMEAAFKGKGILLVPIKGVALIEDLYAGCPVRMSTDIDVLIKEENLAQAAETLEELGYSRNLEGLSEAYWRKKQYHFVYTKRLSARKFVIAELHWDIDYPRKRSVVKGMFKRLRDFIMQGREVKLLSAEDTFLALALHQRRLGLALSLKDVCDMGLLLNKYRDTFSWDYLLNAGRDYGLCSTIFFAFSQVNIFFDADIPAGVWNGLKIPAWKRKSVRGFIERYTFGNKMTAGARNLYLKTHFLLYDNFREPVSYILNIPREQFARYYDFQPYSRKTRVRYGLRYLYMPIKYIFGRHAEKTVYAERKRE